MTTAARMAEIERSLTTTAKKVLDVVPLTEWWSTLDIMAELKRNGINMELSILQGCLKSLLADKLIRQDEQGYRRVATKTPLRTIKSAEDIFAAAVITPPAEQPAQPTDELSVMTKLANLSSSLKAKGNELIAMSKTLDDLAIEVEERVKQVGADAEKLKQLKQILSSLN